MSVLLRFLGLDAGASAADVGSDSLTRIAAELDALPADRARFFACFAYVLARVAHADLRIDADEVDAMRGVLERCAGIGAGEARLVAQIAGAEVDRLGGTDNYAVTREFARLSGPAEKTQLIECLCAVAAADDSISGNESNEILNIAMEIGVPRHDALAIRAGFRDKLAEFRPLRGEQA